MVPLLVAFLCAYSLSARSKALPEQIVANHLASATGAYFQEGNQPPITNWSQISKQLKWTEVKEIVENYRLPELEKLFQFVNIEIK